MKLHFMHEKVKKVDKSTPCVNIAPTIKITETSEHSALRMSALPCC